MRAHGHVAAIILIAMCAMLLTAVSYGRMARAHPSAGSAFSYVGQEINPALGYVVGWSLVMDYILHPAHLHHLVQPAGQCLSVRHSLFRLGGVLHGAFSHC